MIHFFHITIFFYFKHTNLISDCAEVSVWWVSHILQHTSEHFKQFDHSLFFFATKCLENCLWQRGIIFLYGGIHHFYQVPNVHNIYLNLWRLRGEKYFSVELFLWFAGFWRLKQQLIIQNFRKIFLFDILQHVHCCGQQTDFTMIKQLHFQIKIDRQDQNPFPYKT